ncbi:conserved oligomeric Golgi complex component-related / COG complex component-like protein [Wolffia australiana]
MVVIDLREFAEEQFDAKRWINAALSARHPQDTLGRYISDLEESLRSSSESMADTIEKESADALRRVPLAVRDVLRLRDEATALRSVVSSILLKLKKAGDASSESVAALGAIDAVKQRMESAFEILQDAAGLTQLSATVEDVFASGDLPRVAETLGNMRHCLSAVGEVAEFANVREQLAVLENRLEELVQPHLSDALSSKNVDSVQDLQKILLRIGRFTSLELSYTRMGIMPIKKIWDEFDSLERSDILSKERYNGELVISDALAATNLSSFSRWLPKFYDEFLLYLEQEWKWCTVAFPDDYTALVPKLVIESASSVSSAFVSRVNIATGIVLPETKVLHKGLLDILHGDVPKGIKIQTKHLEALTELHNMTNTFAKNIQRLFSETDFQLLLCTLKSVFSPYEPFKLRYGQVERSILSSEISKLDLRGAVPRGVGAQGIELSETVRRMEESIPRVIILLESAVERCMAFTGGTEADELIAAIDETALLYISVLQDTLKSLRSACGIDNSDIGPRKDGPEKWAGPRIVDLVSEEEEWSIVQAALQILTVSDSLSGRISVFEASLRAALARLNTALSLSGLGLGASRDRHVAAAAAIDASVLRLLDLPEKRNKLAALMEQSKDPRFHALPLASQRAAVFADTVNELVYDVLMWRVRQRLSDVSRLATWTSAEEQTAHPLPTFSAYPQAYVTSVGEYLLTLPQQLEPLADGEEAQVFATEWLFKVAEGATALFMEQLRGIQLLTEKGAAQLAADIEYLSNVLSALSMPIPPFLATFYTCVSTPMVRLPELIKFDNGAQLDLPTAHLACRIRRLSLNL